MSNTQIQYLILWRHRFCNVSQGFFLLSRKMAEIIREYSPRNFILGKSFTSSKLKDTLARSRCYKQFQYMLNDRKTDSEISKTVVSCSRGRVKKNTVQFLLRLKADVQCSTIISEYNFFTQSGHEPKKFLKPPFSCIYHKN